jgi:hypothetical protein
MDPFLYCIEITVVWNFDVIYVGTSELHEGALSNSYNAGMLRAIDLLPNNRTS